MAAANGPSDDAQTRPRAQTLPTAGPPGRSERMLNQLSAFCDMQADFRSAAERAVDSR